MTASVRTAAAARATSLTSSMSVPAAGGWTPQQREAYPGYPVQNRPKAAPGASAGSILLPDVLLPATTALGTIRPL